MAPNAIKWKGSGTLHRVLLITAGVVVVYIAMLVVAALFAQGTSFANAMMDSGIWIIEAFAGAFEMFAKVLRALAEFLRTLRSVDLNAVFS